MEWSPSPRTSAAFQKLDLQAQTLQHLSPQLSTQGAHLLIMLLHRFSGITVAELGPLCPTQVTEETAAITQISPLSLSHSNYLTDLASRHPPPCPPRLF